MRKIFYTLGAAAAVATPLIAVVSCGSEKVNPTETTKPAEQTKPVEQKPVEQTKPTEQTTDVQKVETKQTNDPVVAAKQSVSFSLWSTHSIVSSYNLTDPRYIAKAKADFEFWKNHEINGESLTNLANTYEEFKISNVFKVVGRSGRVVLTTQSKTYYFPVTNGALSTLDVFSPSKGAWIEDNATKEITILANDGEADAKVKVTAKEGVAIQTKLPQRSFDAASIAQANTLANFKLNGHAEDYTVTKEGLYIVKHDYDGTLWQGNNKNGHALNDEIVQMPQFAWGQQTVLEMGQGDSIYFLFNDNDNDELSPNNFLTELAFVDTSAKSGEAEVQFNGNAMSGVLDKWEGSQTNHASGTFDEAMMKLMNLETLADFAAIAAYYGVKTTPENGHFVDDPAHVNHASRAFFPMGSVPNYFGYQRVAKNAFKITFNNPLDFNMSMALFRIYNQNTQALSTWGTMSLGDSSEWGAYEFAISDPSAHPEYNFIGRKNEFLTK